MMANKIYWIIIFLFIGMYDYISCVGFDYTDFDDPFQFLWNTKNPVITEPNSQCLGNLANIPVDGVCKSRTECLLTGGRSAGSCGLLSTCCVYTGSCGSTVSKRVSYFRSTAIANRPNCIYQVQLENRNICQLRLDFLQMTLASTAQNEPSRGTCRDEKFFVEGHPNIPQFCGKNSGQHLYIPVNGNDSTPVKLHIDLLPDGLMNRGWTIKITQLQCPGISIFPYRSQIIAMARDFPLLAPQNCLQYFTGLKGSFRSFGFDVSNPDASGYNVNQSYAICFNRRSGVCGISYTADYFKVGALPAVTTPTPSTLAPTTSASTTSDSTSPTPVTPATAAPITASDDYLYIPALKITNNLRDERISGEQEPNTYFTSVTPGPLYAYFMSDSNPDDGNDLGFNIKYELATVCP